MGSGKVVVVAIAALTLAACGQSAAQRGDAIAKKYATTAPATIDQNMRAAMKAVTSLHVYGTYKEGSTTYTMDASIDNAGNCTATVTGGAQSLNMITLNGANRYVRANADYWASSVGVSKSTAGILANQWLSGIPKTALPDVCDLATVVQPFAVEAKDAPTVAGTTTAAGLPAVNLKVVSGTSTATIAVSAAAPHYPLTLVTSDGARSEVLSQFDKPVTPTAPADAHDISTLIK